MGGLSKLERAVLHAIVDQVPEHKGALESQLARANVVERENTGAGFFTTLSVAAEPAIDGLKSPVGDVRAVVAGLRFGFLLWLKNGRVLTLEGYTYGEDGTTGLTTRRCHSAMLALASDVGLPAQ